MSDMRVIRPGDTVIVRLDQTPTTEGFKKMEASWAETLPGVHVFFVTRAAGIDVYRPDPSEAEDLA